MNHSELARDYLAHSRRAGGAAFIVLGVGQLVRPVGLVRTGLEALLGHGCKIRVFADN